MLTSTYLLLALIQATLAGRKVIQQDSRLPVIDKHSLSDQYPKLLLGQDLSIGYDQIYSQFQYRVLRRKSATRGNLSDDYRSHPQLYQDTTLCEFLESDFKPSITASHQFPNTFLVSFQIDSSRNCIYLLTHSSQLYVQGYTTTTDTTGSLLLQFSKLSYKLNLTDNNDPIHSLHFQTTNKLLYIMTEKQLYSIDPDEPNPVLRKVSGMVGDQGVKNASVKWQGSFLVVNRRQEVEVYEVVGETEVRPIQKVSLFQGQKLNVVDVWVEAGELWLLDEEFGLYYFTRQSSKYTEKQSYRIRYGQKLFFKRIGFTFQVVFQLRKNIYIAELNLFDQELILNRFYTQVPGVKDVIFLKELMVVVGDEDAMLIQHSISLQNLKHYLVKEGSWQKKQFVNTYEVNDIQVFQLPQGQTTSAHNTSHLMSITSTTLSLHTITRSPAKLRCHISNPSDIGKHSILVDFNATTCRKSPSIGNYCAVQHQLNFEVYEPTTKAESVLISYALLGGSLCVGLIVLGCILRYRAKKKHEVTELRGVLKRKMDEVIEKPGSGALSI